MFRTSASILVFAGSMVLPNVLFAQDVSFELDTVFLSADRRGEELRDQPRSATVLHGEDLSARQTHSGAGIALQTPGLTFSGFGQPGTDFLNIRGVGPLGYPLSASDHTVAYSVNEVPTSSFGFPPVLLDMEQVEVMRGPQGTLFGRNALAGGLNFVTRGADGASDRSFTLEAGSDGHIVADVAAGGWLVEDRIAGRVVLGFQNFSGDVPNSIADDTEGSAELLVGRVTLAGYTESGWTLSAMLQTDRRETSNSYTLYYEHPNFPESGSDRIPSNTLENRQAVLTAERDFGDVRFTSLTGLQRQDLTGDVDLTDAYLQSAFSGQPIGNFIDPAADRTLTDESEVIFSQEFRLSADETGPFSWVLGANYLRSEYSGRRDAVNATQATSNGVTDVDIETDAWSVFADATWSVNDRLRLSGGIRHGSEEQSVEGLYVSNGFAGTVPRFAQSDSIEDSYTVGRLGLSYDVTDTTTGYLSWSRGYAAGGYEKLLIGSATGVRTEPFEAASIQTWEAGLKFTQLDGRAIFNAALFYNDVTDGQMFDFEFRGGQVFYTFTNQNYRSYGLEIDGGFQVSDSFRVRGSLTLLDSEMYDVSPSTGTGAQNGNQVPLTPGLSASAGFDYDLPIQQLGIAGLATLSMDWSHVGARQAGIANRFELPAYDIVNARLSWQYDNATFYAFSKNLLDERPVHFASQYTSDVRGVSVGTGRVFGVGLAMEF